MSDWATVKNEINEWALALALGMLLVAVIAAFVTLGVIAIILIWG